MSWQTDVEDKISGLFNLVFNPASSFDDIIHVWSGEAGVRPADDYCMFNVLSTRNLGLPFKSAVIISTEYPNGIQNIVRSKSITLSFNSFGRSSMDRCQILKDSIDTEEVQTYLYNNSISILDSTDVVDLSFVESDGTEIRHGFDIMMALPVVVGFESGFIETVDVLGAVEGSDGNSIKDLTLV
jgi:NADPH-dependent 7-cyano-7-deazaguanine reductase QueF-like protein